MKNIIRRIVVVMMIMSLVVAVPIRTEAAGKLNWKKWETTCGETNTIKVTGAKNGKYKYQGKWYTIKYESSDKNASSSKKVIKVDKKGKVTAKKAGSANIDVYIRVGNLHQTINTCKVKVVHDYEKSTEHREPTIFQAGGDVTTSVCKGCGYTKETISNKEDFVYTEDFVVSEMEKIVEYSAECPLLTTYIDGEGDTVTVNGFKSHTEFFNYLVEENLYPSVILDLNTKTKVTTDIKDYGDNNGDCESGVHVFEVLLGNNYECIHRGGKKDGFSFYELKAGDIIYSREGHHTVIFKDYIRFDDGTVYMGNYTGVYGQLLYGENKVQSADAVGVAALKNASVYRLKNYE